MTVNTSSGHHAGPAAVNNATNGNGVTAVGGPGVVVPSGGIDVMQHVSFFNPCGFCFN